MDIRKNTVRNKKIWQLGIYGPVEQMKQRTDSTSE